MNITVIIPTYNEALNIPELVRRIRAHTNGNTQILIVDDSPNEDTREAALDNQCLVNWLPGVKRGLSRAVIDGIKIAQENLNSDAVIIMDADLQHPPEAIPLITEALKDNDFVIASRYIKNGGIEDWGLKRRLISKVANYLATPLSFFKVKDAMSGFAGFKLKGLPKLSTLKPQGYKIVLELLARGKWERVKEVPYTFGVRGKGESKLNRGHFTAYLKQLKSLYLHKFRGIKFVTVGGSGILVNLSLLYVFKEYVGVSLLFAAVIAAIGGISNNYLWNYLWTFKDMRIKERLPINTKIAGWMEYLLMAGTTTSMQIGILLLLVNIFGFWYIPTAFVATLIVFIVNYLVASRWIWKKERDK